MVNIKAWIIKIHAFILTCRIQHILNKDAVPSCRIIYQHVGDGTDEATVLDDGGAGHVCVK